MFPGRQKLFNFSVVLRLRKKLQKSKIVEYKIRSPAAERMDIMKSTWSLSLVFVFLKIYCPLYAEETGGINTIDYRGQECTMIRERNFNAISDEETRDMPNQLVQLEACNVIGNEIVFKLTFSKNIAFKNDDSVSIYLDLDNDITTGRSSPVSLQGTDVLMLLNKEGITFPMYYNTSYKKKIHTRMQINKNQLDLLLDFDVKKDEYDCIVTLVLMLYSSGSSRSDMGEKCVVRIPISTLDPVNIATKKAPELTYQRSEVTSTLKIGKRKRVTAKPLIYARIQPYDIYNNYLNRWIDRPLFLDRQIRTESNCEAVGFVKEMKIAQEYEIDGFTILGSAYKDRYGKYLTIFQDSKIQNFEFMPGLAWSPAVPYDIYLNNAKLAMSSSYSPRINGKVPFFSYQKMPVTNLIETRKKLAADGCGDILLFNDFWVGGLYAEFSKDKTQIKKAVEEMTKSLKTELAAADGLIIFNYGMLRDALGNYTLSKQFNYDLDEKYTVPMFEKVLAENEYTGKMIGFNVRHGYIGCHSGVNEAEYGTEQLRQAMDTALLFNPDIISLVEWNEVNENTCFQPTVYNGKAMQRIIKFYSCILKGNPLSPNKGDDPAIPNCIVSSRQVISLGEKYRIEILNVPDADSTQKYTVRVILKDQDQKILLALPEDTLTVNKLTAITYNVPTLTYNNALAIIPELEIRGMSNKSITITGLQYTRIVPGVCWNFKEVRQPLRDMLRPEKITFSVTAGKSKGVFTAAGEIRTDEELASVEITGDEKELHAVDPLNEFDRKKNHIFLAGFSTRNTVERNVTIRIKNTGDFQFKPWSKPYAGFGTWEKKDDTVQGRLLFFRHGAMMTLVVPRTAQNAVIDFSIEGLGDFSVPVTELLKKEKIAVELPDITMFQIECMDTPADHPQHLNAKEISFTADITSYSAAPFFQIRAITKTGKIFRSAPICKAVRESGKSERMVLFSSSLGSAVSTKVDSGRILAVNYKFTPEFGAFLRDEHDPAMDAYLGGGFDYGEPFRYGNMPANINKTSPQWKQEKNGEWILEFDGIGNYIWFPHEILPPGSFTLEFECKTLSGDNQVLFRHTSHKEGSILLYIIDEKLQAGYASMGPNYNANITTFPLTLDFPAKKWAKVQVIYDMQKISFTINGKTEQFPFLLRGAVPTTAIFGGFSTDHKDITGKKVKFFKGALRSFSVRHNAQ